MRSPPPRTTPRSMRWRSSTCRRSCSDPTRRRRAIVDGLAAAGRRLPVVAVFLTGRRAAGRAARRRHPGLSPSRRTPPGRSAPRRGTADARARRRPRPRCEPAPARDEAAAILARALAAGVDWLDPDDVATLARCYGLPLVSGRDRADAGRGGRAAAADLGGAGRAEGRHAPRLVHKTDVGAVRLGAARSRRRCCAPRAPCAAAAGRRDRPRRIPGPGDGAAGRRAARRRARDDPQFGPVMACAAGGTAAELLADAAVRLAPLSERDVAEMPRALRDVPAARRPPRCAAGRPRGARGRPAAHERARGGPARRRRAGLQPRHRRAEGRGDRRHAGPRRAGRRPRRRSARSRDREACGFPGCRPRMPRSSAARAGRSVTDHGARTAHRSSSPAAASPPWRR